MHTRAERGWDAVIWAAFQPNFEEKLKRPFSPANAIEHLNSLTGGDKALAEEYILKAPPEVDTLVRRAFLDARQDANA